MFSCSTQKTAEKIFEENSRSVVELKASTENVGDSFGTAIIIDKSGTLVTCAHIITYSKMGETFLFDDLSIRYFDEEQYQKVSLLKFSVELDVAYLKISSETYQVTPVLIGDSNQIKHGQKILAMGNSMNRGIGITEGIISVPSVLIHISDKIKNCIQCDITIAEGNSGGALFN